LGQAESFEALQNLQAEKAQQLTVSLVGLGLE